jgi:hypothetical protein
VTWNHEILRRRFSFAPRFEFERLFVPDEPVVTTQEATLTPVERPDPLAEERKVAEAAADKYFAEQQATEAPPVDTRLRGPDGKFIPKEGVSQTTEPAVPKIGNEWIEAAKLEGFTSEQIAAFTTDQEAQQQVGAKRIVKQQEAMRVLGIDEDRARAFQQWEQQQRGARNVPADPQQLTPDQIVAQFQQQTQQIGGNGVPRETPQQQVAAAIEALKLELKEDDLAPEMVTPFRTIETHANKLAKSVETLASENTQLRNAILGVYSMVQQRAEQDQAAAREVQAAAQWDEAAKGIPGFVEVLGLPSEVRRLPPDDLKVQQYVAYRAYFEPTWSRYAAALGPNSVALQKVMADAFRASPFALMASANGKNTGTSGNGTGSVIRSAQRQSSASETPVGPNDLEAELRRISDVAARAFDNSDGKPFGDRSAL